MPERLRPTFELLEKAVTEVHEGRLPAQRASAMASLTGAMIKIIKAGENTNFSLPPQFFYSGIDDFYAAIRNYRRIRPRLAGDPPVEPTDEDDEDDKIDAELDEWEREHGKVKLPEEWI